jgi:hypothetical protein
MRSIASIGASLDVAEVVELVDQRADHLPLPLIASSIGDLQAELAASATPAARR